MLLKASQPTTFSAEQPSLYSDINKLLPPLKSSKPSTPCCKTLRKISSLIAEVSMAVTGKVLSGQKRNMHGQHHVLNKGPGLLVFGSLGQY
jgi:hypothetical protein